jgi:hypothetical protein
MRGGKARLDRQGPAKMRFGLRKAPLFTRDLAEIVVRCSVVGVVYQGALEQRRRRGEIMLLVADAAHQVQRLRMFRIEPQDPLIAVLGFVEPPACWAATAAPGMSSICSGCGACRGRRAYFRGGPA